MIDFALFLIFYVSYMTAGTLVFRLWEKRNPCPTKFYQFDFFLSHGWPILLLSLIVDSVAKWWHKTFID